MKKKKGRNTIKYSKLVIFTSLFLFVIMIARLLQLSMSKEIDGTNLKDLASKRTTKTETLSAKRGSIYTSSGDVLAQNVTSYKLIAYLSEKRTIKEDNPQHVVDKEQTAEKLAPILGTEKDKILKYLNRENIYQTEFGNIGKNLTEIEKSKIEELNLPGIDFIESYKRYYPKGNFLSYTLGYAVKELNKDNEEVMTGKMGLELYYDNILKGEDGYITYQKDLKGYKIAGTNEIKHDAVEGKDIYLTIDGNIQFFVEQALTKAKENHGYEWFTMVILEAKTGKILAMSSNPNFDPNTRENITNYLDLTISLPYEPGSTMKTYTYMASMENGLYDGNATFKSGVYVTKDKTEIGDWNRNGWGYITFDRGYALSSNTGIINLINNNMNAVMLRQYYHKLGFGKKTGIPLPNEQKGSLGFKYETEIYNAGFGQGITTTPMQNVQAMTPLTNDGILLRPYLVEKIIDPSTGENILTGKRKEVERVASSETVNKMIKLMDDTVNIDGNTGSAYKIHNGELIGKTGTAQIASDNGTGYLNGKEDIISSFSGIYPKSNPEVIIYASMKRPTNGSQKPIQDAVKEVVMNLEKYYGHSENTFIKDNITNYTVESFVNKKTSSVKETLTSNNINNQIIIGAGDKVTKQYPKKGSKITSKDKVFLITNDSNLTIPNLTGYSRKEAENLLDLLNVKYKIEGTGYITSQSIPENTPITTGMEISLTLNPKF